MFTVWFKEPGRFQDLGFVLIFTIAPRESHGQKCLESYSPKGRKESDMIERLSMHACPLER